MNEFREWLSDNLRYFMLGFGILFVLLLIILGVRLIAGHGSDSGDKKSTVSTVGSEASDTKSDVSGSVVPDASSAGETGATGTVELSEDTKLITLVQGYYEALSNRDTEAVRALVDQLSYDQETKISEATDIESYSEVTVYAKAGPAEGTWVVYAAYKYKYQNYETAVPGLARLYVITDDEGNYVITNGTVEEDVQTYIDKQLEDEDVKALMQTVQDEYDLTLASDENLRNYINNKGKEVSSALDAEDGTELKIAMDCNVRAAADITANKLGTLTAGTTVVKKGSEGEWIQIEYEGQTAYVRYDMFE